MIDSPTNPTVKALRALTATKARRERRQFLAEGIRVVEDGLRAGFQPEVCLYNRELLERTERGVALLDTLLSARNALGSSQALEASERALQAATDTLHPQGVVAAFPLVQRAEIDLLPGSSALAAICDDIQDPGNLGTILRTAEAAGVHATFLTQRCVDVYNPKVVRGAMGAHFRLPIYADCSWEAIRTRLGRLGVPAERVYAADAHGDVTYDEAEWRGPSALIVANEAHGLSAEAREIAGCYISIPMSGGTESLNAAISAAIILFEAVRQRRQSAL